jgi:glyoxylase-like metal-dependent hydrolase (beta-lactamase superfamily II)
VDHLLLDGEVLPLIPFAGGHSANLTTILLPGGRLISSELVYQGHHLFLREQRIAGWRANLDQLTALAAKRGITILIPSHGQPCGLDELERMRAYFTALEDAVASGDRAVAAARMQAAFPAYRMPRFLTDYTLPAYLP